MTLQLILISIKTTLLSSVLLPLRLPFMQQLHRPLCASVSSLPSSYPLFKLLLMQRYYCSETWAWNIIQRPGGAPPLSGEETKLTCLMWPRTFLRMRFFQLIINHRHKIPFEPSLMAPASFGEKTPTPLTVCISPPLLPGLLYFYHY